MSQHSPTRELDVPDRCEVLDRPICEYCAEHDLTRRSFVQTMGSAALATGTLSWLPEVAILGAQPNDPKGAPPDRKAKLERPRYRAVSWWLTWDDLAWPNGTLVDQVRRRADRCAASSVNCCILFGAHFRWDFMPLWERLHGLLRFVRDELHARSIQFFDHHSSVLVHRPRNQEEARNIWQKNRHHVPFYPSLKAASEWQFNGSRFNDWRMIDVESNEPAYLPAYNAEQFCMNNASFQEAYSKYLKLLIEETAIDGLMSDDAIFYPGWRVCRCTFCLDRFKREYGHELPPIADTTFWGNRNNRAFRDWIAMRFRTSGDFFKIVRNTLPNDFPLLTCCSSSDDQTMPALGMSYQDFIHSCNLVMLEMVGSTPTIQGTWDNRIPSQMLHLAIARDAHVPCLGLGYGFFPDTAFFIWALNKLLGSDCWFSTLKGRLGASPEELASLVDDSELVSEAYQWEAAHPDLFRGEIDADTAVLFSRTTRDFYARTRSDYAADYQASCLRLLHAGIPYEVATTIPSFGRIRQLVLSSALCLSQEERNLLNRFLSSGGTIIATGPIGFYDENAEKVEIPWLHEQGMTCELIEPIRQLGFPPDDKIAATAAVAQCRISRGNSKDEQKGWHGVTKGKGRLTWCPARFNSKGAADQVIELLKNEIHRDIVLKGLPASWRWRQYRDGSRLLVHALPSQVITALHPTLINQISGERVVKSLDFAALDVRIQVHVAERIFRKVILHSPDFPELRAGSRDSGGDWSVDAKGVRRYLILECCDH
ncbi:MAG: hypothetical protein IT427_16555 [Pirellulales bacterium]|nr:hypothetical protein [Pirellulales bacterium]